MMDVTSTVSAPWETLLVCTVLMAAPVVVQPQRRVWSLLVLLVMQAAALFAKRGDIAYGAVAVSALLHAASAWPVARTGSVMLVLSALLSVGTAVALPGHHLTAALALSCVAIALRAGVMPWHVGVASLTDRAPVVQTQQMASLVALVFVHLRFVDHHAVAVQVAPWLVRVGAGAALLAAVITLVQRDLRGFVRGTTAMHGGMLLAAIGTASIGNFGAALLVAVTMGLAIGGLGIVTGALEARVGAVDFNDRGGRVAAFPVLAATFALFGGAGVGLPGMAGFVADDLLLHTLWMESPASTVAMILSSAFLAVATLMAYSTVFLGRNTPSLAPDLLRRERVVATTLILLLLLLGFAPGVLLGPADAFLSGPPAG